MQCVYYFRVRHRAGWSEAIKAPIIWSLVSPVPLKWFRLFRHRSLCNDLDSNQRTPIRYGKGAASAQLLAAYSPTRIALEPLGSGSGFYGPPDIWKGEKGMEVRLCLPYQY